MFTNKVNPPSLFSTSLSTTSTWPNPNSKPNTSPNNASNSLWSASAQNSSLNNIGQSSNKSILSNNTVGAKQTLPFNSTLQRSSGNGLFQTQSSNFLANGGAKEPSKGLMSLVTQQGNNAGSNTLFKPNTGSSNPLFGNQNKSTNSIGLWNSKPDTQKPLTQGSGLLTQSTPNNSLFKPNNNTAQSTQNPFSTLFPNSNGPINKPNPPSSTQSSQNSMFASLLSNTSTQPPKQPMNGSSGLWQNTNNTQQSQQTQSSAGFWQNNQLANNNKPLGSIFNLPTQSNQLQSQPKQETQLFKNSNSLFPMNNLSQPALSKTFSFGPSQNNNVGNKNGLPFSWTAPSHKSSQNLFKPKDGNQGVLQWSSSSSSVFSQTERALGCGNQSVPQWPTSSVFNQKVTSFDSTSVQAGNMSFGYQPTQGFGSSDDTEFFQRLGARLGNKENIYDQDESLPYNIFEESSTRRNFYKYNDNLVSSPYSHKRRKSYLGEEEFSFGNSMTKKELTAFHYSRDLVRTLKSQGNRTENLPVNAFDAEIKPKKEFPAIIYVVFLGDDGSERTFALDVSRDSSVSELNKAVLDIIFENDSSIDSNSFRLHKNGELLDESKNLSDLNINTLDSLILEKIEFTKNEKKILTELPTKKKAISASLLPKVPEGYKIQPTLLELSKMSEDEVSQVEGFTISNKEASVEFEGKIDLRGLDLTQIVMLGHKTIEIYPESGFVPLPNVGEGLNRPARIEFYNWSLPAKYAQNSEKYLHRVNQWAISINAKLESYDIQSEKVTLSVKNFGKTDE